MGLAMSYAEACREIKRKGVARVTGVAEVAVMAQTLALVHPAISPKILFEGAVKRGVTAEQLRKMPVNELSDLMFA